jgi:hypothetical protein
MRKIRSSRLLSDRPRRQRAQVGAPDQLCEGVAELRSELAAALARLSDTVRQTETILLQVPRLMPRARSTVLAVERRA